MFRPNISACLSIISFRDTLYVGSSLTANNFMMFTALVYEEQLQSGGVQSEGTWPRSSTYPLTTFAPKCRAPQPRQHHWTSPLPSRVMLNSHCSVAKRAPHKSLPPNPTSNPCFQPQQIFSSLIPCLFNKIFSMAVSTSVYVTDLKQKSQFHENFHRNK